MIFKKNKYGGMVIVSCDIGAGSSGKGSLNSWIAYKYDIDIAVDNWASNAGHFTELDDGTRILVQHVPSSFINRKTLLYINAGASIDIDILLKEVKMLDDLGFDVSSRLMIHPNANIITENDKEIEKHCIESGSTFKGCGAALASKAIRKEIQISADNIGLEKILKVKFGERKLASSYTVLNKWIKDHTFELNQAVVNGKRILIEGSQGMDLDINFGEYPFCTSRQCHPTQLLADAGLPPHCVTNIVANIRTNPIRISNISAADGSEKYSGNYWDGKEITWEEVATRGGWSMEEFNEKYNKSLMTSVTKKIRRVFEFPKERFKYTSAICGNLLDDDTLIYSLNFINFIDKNVDGVKTKEELFTDKVNSWLEENLYPIIGKNKLKFIRTGAKHSEIIELDEGVKE